MSVQTESLTKLYGDQRAVDQLTFSVGSGQICGFLGPNGAGKTTTMKMLSCFTTPSSGTAFVGGFDVEKNPIEVRRILGYLPEHNPLYKNMYVREYLHFVGQLFKLKNIRQRVDDMIAYTGLGQEQHKQIGALSKGYRQRVGLAQALIHDPQVLILDEPTSGLDPNQLADIRKLIRSLGENKTVLFSSHIMQEVEAICDRIIIIDKGKLVVDSNKEELKQKIQGRQRIELDFENAPPLADILDVDGVIRVEKKGEQGFIVWCNNSIKTRKEIFQFSAQKQYILLEMKHEDVSVESVFQQLTSS